MCWTQDELKKKRKTHTKNTKKKNKNTKKNTKKNTTHHRFDSNHIKVQEFIVSL